MTSLPPKIDILPEHLIDQIKAGEVIERPGNLIKEILENAVDAGASKLELTIRNNGLDLICLKDDGHGMRLPDLPLAFSRHATSKISRFEDLYQLNSFGFRGEALASIASISRLQCISFVQHAETGAEIRIEGGQIVLLEERRKSGKLTGTELIIQDLFYNTPARLKFIQSQNSEKLFIKKMIFGFILSNPGIEFQIKFNDDEKEIFPATQTLPQRLIQVFPKSKDLLLHSRRVYDNIELDLYLIPGNVRGMIKCQNIHINGRIILDKQLHRVISNGLKALNGHDEFHYLVLLQLPPDNIDVNVHPNKTIIKCLETSKMISLITSTLKELLTQGIRQPHAVTPYSVAPDLLNELGRPAPSLLQERHAYNMEGFFSPHSLPLAGQDDFIWMGAYFIFSQQEKWTAVSARGLLELFIEVRLNTESNAIPLMVSEPYPSATVKASQLEKLRQGGLELEQLGPDTLVLRSIPEWMNGFPLKDVVSCLLTGEKMSEISINPADWSRSTWEEMLQFLPREMMREKKVLVDLQELLKEKLK